MSDLTEHGFILNIGFFSEGDPGFTQATIKSLISQLSSLGFGVNFQENSFPKDAGKIEAKKNGHFKLELGDFRIGSPTVADPLLINLPHSQSAFSIRIPVLFSKKLKSPPTITGTYLVDTATLIGQE